MPAPTSPSFGPAVRNSSSSFAGFRPDAEGVGARDAASSGSVNAGAAAAAAGVKGRGKMSKLPGGNKAIAAFVLSLVAFTVQTEAAQYVQQGLGYRKPFLSLYLGHSSFMALLPLHLAFLRLHDPSRPLSHYLHLIAQNLHWQLSAARKTNEKLPPTAERVRRRLSSLGAREDFDEEEEEEVRGPAPARGAAMGTRPPKHNSWMEERCGFSPLRLIRVLGILTIGMTIPALSWYSAVPLTTMADITTIYNTYAVWALVFSVYFLGEKWERRKVLAVLLAVGGVVLVAYGGAEHRTKLREPDPVFGKPTNGTTPPTTTLLARIVGDAEPEAQSTAARPVLGALLSLLGAVTMAGYEMAFALLGGLPDEAAQKARYAARAARRPRSSTIDYAYSRASAEHEALLGGNDEHDARSAPHHTLGDSDDEAEIKAPSSPIAKRAAPTVSVKSVPAATPASSDDEDAASDTGASASSLSDGEADEVAAGATRLGRARSTSNLPSVPASLPTAAAVAATPRATARPQLGHRTSTKSLHGEDWMPPPLNFGLHANIMTSGIGAVTFFTLWLGIPIAHLLGWETFELPHNWTTVACLALVAVMGIFFNGCFMILLSLWGPVLASVSCLLTTVLVFLADLILGSEFRWLSLLGCGIIAAGFGVLVSGEGMARH